MRNVWERRQLLSVSNEPITEDKSQILFQHMTIKGEKAQWGSRNCDVRITSEVMPHYVGKFWERNTENVFSVSLNLMCFIVTEEKIFISLGLTEHTPSMTIFFSYYIFPCYMFICSAIILHPNIVFSLLSYVKTRLRWKDL